MSGAKSPSLESAECDEKCPGTSVHRRCRQHGRMDWNADSGDHDHAYKPRDGYAIVLSKKAFHVFLCLVAVLVITMRCSSSAGHT